MGLADKFSKTDQLRSGLPCGIGTLLQKLPKPDREALQGVMAQEHSRERISNRQIHEVLLEEGHDIAFHSVSAHRRKQCRCYIGQTNIDKSLLESS